MVVRCQGLAFGFGDPGGEFLPGAVLDLDDDAGDAGDVAAVLGAAEGAAFGLGEAEGAQEADDGGFGGGALGFGSAHSRVSCTGWGGHMWSAMTV